MSTEIVMKGDARVRAVEEVINFLEWWDPKGTARARKEMASLKQISRVGYEDSQGRYTHVRAKVPTMLWCCCQAVIPEWGQDPDVDDMALLTKVCKAYNGGKPYKSSSMFVPETYGKGEPNEQVAAKES